jgi:hypothetical protein
MFTSVFSWFYFYSNNKKKGLSTLSEREDNLDVPDLPLLQSVSL